MEQYVNIETVVHETKIRWLREEAPRKPIRYRIAESVPYWIMLVALGLFILSASHTAQMFKAITGDVGIFATVVVEFGLLYAAAQRRLAKSKGGKLERVVWLFEILLIFTAVLVNGIGSLTTAVEKTGLTELSAMEVLAAFGGLPLGAQGALVLAMLAAVIIPTGVIAAGEQVAKLMLESEAHADDYQERVWQERQETIIYQAVYARYREVGLDAKAASKHARNEVRAYLQSGRVSRSPRIPASIPVRDEQTNEQRTSANNEQARTGERTSTRTTNSRQKRELVEQFFANNPDVAKLQVREAVDVVQEAGIDAKQTLVYDVWSKYRD